MARADEASIQRRLADHLGAGAGALPVASGSWPRYDQVNVQAGLDAWLAEPGREHGRSPSGPKPPAGWSGAPAKRR